MMDDLKQGLSRYASSWGHKTRLAPARRAESVERTPITAVLRSLEIMRRSERIKFWYAYRY
jgi:hypothetical protein